MREHAKGEDRSLASRHSPRGFAWGQRISQMQLFLSQIMTLPFGGVIVDQRDCLSDWSSNAKDFYASDG
jgi:hypothetical protein